MGSTFADWLQEEMDGRELSQADLVRLSGISNAQVSRIVRGERLPGTEALVGIARALKLPPTQVFRVAGILPRSNDADPGVEAIMHDLHGMSATQLEEIRLIIRAHKEAWERASARKVKERPRRA